MSTDLHTVNGQSILIAHEAVQDQGEDCYAAETDTLGGLLCVADGCGGIGSRRYEKLEQHTEAYIAARLAVECVREWVAALDGRSLPQTAENAQHCAGLLCETLHKKMCDFHSQYHNDVSSRVIMRGLQRTLPTTLCAALIDARATGSVSCVFFWVGDSRGYVLSEAGLRQCTADHVAGQTDAMENLYRDSRLTNVINADGAFTIDTYGLTLQKPCVVLTATDGAFSYLPTPMEFELLLLSTLQAATSLAGWQSRLRNALGKLASDDSTLAMTCFGFEQFEDLQAFFAPRRAMLQAKYITPVRRRKQSIDYARGLWAEYRQNYELSEEVRHADWRL